MVLISTSLAILTDANGPVRAPCARTTLTNSYIQTLAMAQAISRFMAFK